MWERVDYLTPTELASVTTSVWEYPAVVIIGVMRASMLCPPCLWAVKLHGGHTNVKRGPTLLDELQELIRAKTVFAETEIKYPRNKALLKYLGFTELRTENERTLFTRSI